MASCRLTHESFASVLALSLARTRHPDIDRILSDYPLYRPLASRLLRLLSPVSNGHRLDLAATAIARWSMSAPVIDLVCRRYPETVALSDIPADWRPDHRYRTLARLVTDAAVGDARSAADAAFERLHGRPVDNIGLDETDAVLDGAWREWEETFIGALVAAYPRLAAMATVPPDGHIAGADRLVRALADDGIEIGLPHHSDEGPVTDVESVRRLTSAASLHLRRPYRSALAVIGDAVDLEPVLALCAASTTPFVVLHGRRRASLRRQFDFADAQLAGPEPRPVFALRVLVDDAGDDLILHAE